MPVNWEDFEPVQTATAPKGAGVDWSQFEPEKPKELPLPTFETPSYDYMFGPSLRPQSLGERLRGSDIATRLLGPEVPTGMGGTQDIGLVPVLTAAPLPFAPGPESMLGKALLGYFVGKFSLEQPEKIGQIKDAIDAKDWHTLRGLVGDELFQTAFTGLAAHGLLKEGQDWRGLRGIYGERYAPPGQEPIDIQAEVLGPRRIEPTGQDLRTPPGARPPAGEPPQPLQLLSPEQAAAQELLMQRTATSGYTPPAPPRPPKASVPVGPLEPPVLDESMAPPPKDLSTWGDYVEDLRARGTGTMTRAQIQQLYPHLQLSRETAAQLAQDAFGENWKPEGQPRQEAPSATKGEISPTGEIPTQLGQPAIAEPKVETEGGIAQPLGPGAQGAQANVPPQAPEVAKLGTSEKTNKLGHPYGTTYHATPEDWAEWQRLMSLPMIKDGQIQQDVWQAREAMKNKYGGMPPEAPKTPAPAAEQMVTLYHGKGGAVGGGAADGWWTTDPTRAASFGPEVWTVQVPKSVADAAQEAARQAGSGTGTDHVLPDEWVKKATKMEKPPEPKVFDTDIIAKPPEAPPAAPPVAPQGPIVAPEDPIVAPGATPVSPQTPVAAPEAESLAVTPALAAADQLVPIIRAGRPITKQMVHDIMAGTHGGTMAEGKFTSKDLTDVVELAVNRFIAANPEALDPFTASPDQAQAIIQNLKGVLERLPTQTTRTPETDKMQQFSTPPTEAFAVAWVAKVGPEDTALEPSIGIGGIAVFAKVAGAQVIGNELSPRRRAIVEVSGIADKVYPHNAEHLHALMVPEINHGRMRQPTVVLMNPPFSSGAFSGVKATHIGARHVEEALKLLVDGGRLVAVVGEGMASDRPHFRDWWARIQKTYNVRANIGVSGEEYRKYGTTFGNQIIVIDKTGPTPEGGIITGKVNKVEDLIPLLEKVRNDRGRAQPRPAQPGGIPPIAPGQPPIQPQGTVPAPTGTGGPGAAGRPAGPGQRPTPQPGGRLQPGVTPPVVSPPAAPLPSGPGRTPEPAPGPSGGPPSEQPPAAPTSSVTVQKPTAERELSESGVFSKYVPQKVHVEGTSPHPAPLMEPTAMAAVEPVDPTYKPVLSKQAIAALSDPQIEQVIYAGQSHQNFLPDGSRQGYFIGDGTGVGKGREQAAIFADNWNQGRKKGVWISAKRELIKASQRDFDALGLEPKKTMIDFMAKGGKGILGAKEGIAFVTYNSMTIGHEGIQPSIDPHAPSRLVPPSDPNKPSRMQLLYNWLGPDFDGVISLDESHFAGNAMDIKGDRGIEKASQRGKMVLDLRRLFPKARYLYVSATGATDITNLSYAEALGIWGPGTPFPQKAAFFNAIGAGGLSAMEIVARDLKATGKYLARSLSMEGVKHEPLTHVLTPEQVRIYDELARAWQLVNEARNDTMAATGQANNGRSRGQANSRFWGAQQRFFNQLMNAMQMPTIMAKIHASLDAGHSVLIQLVNTNLSILDRELANKGAEAGEGVDWLEDLDLSPKDILLQYVDDHYPTHQFQQVIDDNGNAVWQLMVDANNNPVENPEAVAKKQELMDRIKLTKAPQNPLEMIINTFGPENVAEITGRDKRVVMKKQADGTVKAVREPRSDSVRAIEYQEFNDLKRRILIFSDKGGTGIDLHAGRTFKNQQQRDHILLQAGWRADNVIQGLGRSNRTNQAQPPHQFLGSTNLSGHRRFISTIMRRLSEMGSITGGERKSAGRQLFNEDDDLENAYAEAAILRFYRNLHAGEYADMSFDDLARRMGFIEKRLNQSTGEIEEFNKLIDSQSGTLNQAALPPVHMFLNRILALEVAQQNRTFEAFDEERRNIIETAKADGSYDPGTQKLRALEIRKVKDEVVYSDPRSTAKTRLVEIEHDQPVKVYPWDKINTVAADRPVLMYVRNVRSGHVFALKEGPARTMQNGMVLDTWRRIGPTGYDIVTRSSVVTQAVYGGEKANYEELDERTAKPLWDQAVEKAPKVKTLKDTYLVGAMLPIWDRIQLQRPRIWRMTTNQGETMLGVHIPSAAVDGIRDRLGAGAGEQPTPKIVFQRVFDNNTNVELANGWVIKRSRVAGDYRIEVRGVEQGQMREWTDYIGGYIERIAYEPRFFVPTDEDAALPVLQRILEKSPVITRRTPGAGPPPAVSYFDRASEAYGLGRISGAPTLEDVRAARAADLSGGLVAEPLMGPMKLYSGLPLPMTMAEMKDFIQPLVDASAAARRFWRGFSMKQAPKITDADRETGEAGVRYAVAPFVARQHGLEFAGKVMAGITDRNFDTKLGAAISEDNLRDIRQRNLDLADEVRNRDELIAAAREEIANFKDDAAEGDVYSRQIIKELRARIRQLEEYTDEDADRFEALAKGTFSFIGKPGSPFPTEEAYQAFLASADAKVALDRHRNLWREQKDPLFRLANDLDPDTKLETRGLETDARINLKAIREANEVTKTTVGARRSTLTKQTATLKRKDPFAIRAEGQGQAYESSYTELLAHGFEREFPIAAQHEFLRRLIDSGNASLSTGEFVPDLQIKGEGTKGYLMKLRPWTGRFLQLRKSLAQEYEAIAGLNPAARIPFWTRMGEFLTKQSIIGLAEGSTHAANLMMEVFTGLGPTSHPMLNALIKSIGRADLIYRVPAVIIKGMGNTREEMLALATIGAAKQPYAGLMGRLLNWGDRGVRLNAAEIYKGMAEAGWVENTETGLREFVNQLGSYNKKLQPFLVRLLRDTHVQPFATAMQTFNIMGLRRMALAPGAKATSMRAAAALRADILGGWIGFLILVAFLNYLINGKPEGPKGTRLGAVGWVGEDKKIHQLDLGLLTGYTRGLRITGIQAGIEAKRQGLTTHTAVMAGTRSLANTAISVVSGPAVQFVTKAATGMRPGVPMVQEAKVMPPQENFDPLKSQMAENIKTALRESNPAVDGVVSIIEGKPTEEVLNRQLSRYTPRTGMSEETIANLPRIVKTSEVNAYADAVAKESRKVPIGQRPKWIMERLQSDQLSPEVKARALIELRRKGAFAYP